MGLLSDIMATESLNAFANLDEFGESAVYTTSAGVARTVQVQVFRGITEAIPGQSEGYVAPISQVFLPAGQGITSIDTGGDTVAIADDIGAPVLTLPVTMVVSQDAGGWMLKLV